MDAPLRHALRHDPCRHHGPVSRALAFGDGLSLVAEAGCLHFYYPQSLRTLSNALVGEGLGWVRDFCNFYVDRDYAGQTPTEDLRRWLAARGLVEDSGGGRAEERGEGRAEERGEGRAEKRDEALAMMTAVPLAHLALVPVDVDDVDGRPRVLAAVTAGVGNAVDITAPASGDPRLVAGTINVLVFVDGHLTDGALVNAALSATEAKVQALAADGVRDPEHGTPATGTSTDCLAIAATQRGAPTPYAGSGTRLGRAIGAAVYRAVRESLAAGEGAA
ncbi:iron complex transport system ATP-binding protein [Halomonas organivorans]|uniref:Iron complex transport system ATP-binding protein n=2 Tax=Halomonas organivorans TaxID=257772 RepID=A0A7W5C0K2_9GAMM|nr:adenosylcobinamide amidohydrolase [Halomonas organivorans]MBB3142417.1 iron complex transport system ATP-binding protein [Halomonas organivorans]